MKKILICFALILAIAMPCWAADVTFPRRDALKVDDVNKSYSEGWIVLPEEEPVGDQTTKDVLETDIYGVASCYDEEYLRVDIELQNPVSFEWDSFYMVKFEYADSIAYFTYYPYDEMLVFQREKNGQIVTTETMDLFEENDDNAWVSAVGDIGNVNVGFIIKKSKYFGGEKGKTYYLTSSFSAGYVGTNNKLVTTDQTITVLLHFVM